MNTSANEAKNQQVSSGRRGLMKKISAAAMAAVTMTAATAQESVAIARPAPASGKVFDESTYSQETAAHLCLMGALLREFVGANEDRIRAVAPDLAADLFDIAFEASASARQLTKAAGIRLDANYIAQRAAAYRSSAASGAAKAAQAGKAVTPQQRALLAYFNAMSDVAQDFVVAVAANNARVFPRQRPKLRVVAGGQA
jgi:hypothetical protein